MHNVYILLCNFNPHFVPLSLHARIASADKKPAHA